MPQGAYVGQECGPTFFRYPRDNVDYLFLYVAGVIEVVALLFVTQSGSPVPNPRAHTPLEPRGGKSYGPTDHDHYDPHDPQPTLDTMSIISTRSSIHD